MLAVYDSVTPGGEKVHADLSGQFWGRLPLRRAAWDEEEDAEPTETKPPRVLAADCCAAQGR